MKRNIRNAAVILATCAISIFNSPAAFSQTQWQDNHPRRAEVNHRLANQDARIKTERRDGEISGAKAHRLHQEDRNIRHEERSMAHRNNGHITRGEQGKLNRQENRESRQIGR